MCYDALLPYISVKKVNHFFLSGSWPIIKTSAQDKPVEAENLDEKMYLEAHE